MEIKNMLPLEDQNLGKIKTAFLKCETLNGIMSYWKYFSHCTHFAANFQGVLKVAFLVVISTCPR